MAKNVIVVVDGQLAMAVVPATKDVDLNALCTQAGAREVRLASEAEFVTAFAGSQLGAVPPFGILYGVKTFVDIGLTVQEQIAFNAGTHTDVIRIWYSDYNALVKPQVLNFAVDPTKSQPKRSAKIPRTPVRRTVEPVHHMASD